jgi:hypothetical protein
VWASSTLADHARHARDAALPQSETRHPARGSAWSANALDVRTWLNWSLPVGSLDTGDTDAPVNPDADNSVYFLYQITGQCEATFNRRVFDVEYAVTTHAG